ncbi:hypothetical protein PR048_011020 [Dryococelus australis]|uniref:CCHC-type domain-containing protein n=1 Tax=Dryococelus australis TaxID=614101 RepID=A0ABQ9HKE7_9NEOP|nr:hypothetical protein PR048_011020 [Dryococelus australis]
MASWNNFSVIERLEGKKKYRKWRTQMEYYLGHEDLWDLVSDSNISTEEITEAQHKRDTKARCNIGMLVHPQYHIHLEGKDTAKKELKSEFQPLRITLRTSSVPLTTDYVMGQLLQQEYTSGGTESNTLDRAFFTQDRGRNNQHVTQKNRNGCFICGRPGHHAANCYKNPNRRKPWIAHQEIKILLSLQHCANNEKLRAEGLGRAEVYLKDIPGITTIKDVMFVPNITVNLLSVSKLVCCGWSVLFSSAGCMIYKEEDLNINGKSNNEKNIDITLWHRRLGHLGYSNMLDLISISHGMKLIGDRPNQEFVECLVGKQLKQPYKKLGPQGQLNR